jgi:DNA topoisomerase-1
MAKRTLVIVESPTKGKTIRKFLPKEFVIEASFGHVRDLPQSAADIPAKLKDEEWTKLGVNVENDFEALYVVPKDKTKRIRELKELLKDADALYLATDEDREGESISWHLLELLKPKCPVKRMVFHEITKPAILEALAHPRDIDMKLVRAQETRRILDRLVGYTLSPLLWKKIAFGLSAGRVQSVALRQIIERERDRIRFQKGSYWDLLATLKKDNEEFEARLYSYNGQRIATGKDFDENTGAIVADKAKDLILIDEKTARELEKTLKTENFVVESIDEKPTTAKPLPPFITSTLQQEANRKLGLSSRDAMRTAQSLYEQGYITYMRTDSPNLSTQAMGAARKQIEELYGKEFLAEDGPRQFASKDKGAQEAHEAIRPAGAEFVHPKDTDLSGPQLKLYELIWKRTLASQMSLAKKLSISVRMTAGKTEFQANGSRIIFPGYLRVYVEGSDDPEAALEDREVQLPKLIKGEKLQSKTVEAQPHETKPPARYTEASLLQMLEKEGIGRPSTYASIISTIQDRGYVLKQGNAMVPTFTGFAVTQLLEKYFAELVDPKFTSSMEEVLDEIAEGKREYLPYLKQFFLGKNGLQTQVSLQEKKIDPDESRTIKLDHLKGIEVKVGRYGAYMIKPGTGDKKGEEIHASIPETISPAELTLESVEEILLLAEKGPESIGKDPATGLPIYVLIGRYGPYFQAGEVVEGSDKKPRRGPLPKGKTPSTVTLEEAILALSLPRELGLHPDSKKPILANVGRFGPYIMHDGDFRSLKKDDNVYTVTLARGLELLSEEKKGRGGSKALRDLGPHPKDQKIVSVFSGKFGPYVKHGATNATIPKDKDPEKITLAEALELIEARLAKGGGKPSSPAKSGPARPSPKPAAPQSNAAKTSTANANTAKPNNVKSNAVKPSVAKPKGKARPVAPK